jgi:hypothetical protein
LNGGTNWLELLNGLAPRFAGATLSCEMIMICFCPYYRRVICQGSCTRRIDSSRMKPC